MKKYLYYLLKTISTISYLEIITVTTLGVIISLEAVTAKPLCYLVDANGRILDLDYLCEKPQKIPQPKMTPAKANNTDETTPTSTVENPEETTNNQEPIQPEPTKAEEKIDTSKSAPAQRTIPLLEK